MRSHFEIVTTDSTQPHLVRLMGDNGEEIFKSSENYAEKAGAERAVCIAAEAFYRGYAELIDNDDNDQVPDGEKRIRVGSSELGGSSSLSVPVVYVDERQKFRRG